MSRTRAHTERLLIREVTEADAGFILELVNTPGWLRFIGDRQIHDPEAARQFIVKGPLHFYKTHGYGSYCLTLKDSGTPIGMCGLYRRDTLNMEDLGFALLPAYEGKGYVSEACAFILEEARSHHGKSGLLAIASQGNARSIRLLERLGFQQAGFFQFDATSEELFCFRLDFAHPPDTEPFMIRLSDTLSATQKEQVRAIWNAEYPSGLVLPTPEDFDAYLSKSTEHKHFLLCTIEGDLKGWGCTFQRDNARWFAMILSRSIHGKGLGTFLLQKMLQGESQLYGWVIETTPFNRTDGTPYPLPLEFYLKNGFHAETNERLDIPAFSGHRIVFTRES